MKADYFSRVFSKIATFHSILLTISSQSTVARIQRKQHIPYIFGAIIKIAGKRQDHNPCSSRYSALISEIYDGC
jgi:hypothetical protein